MGTSKLGNMLVEDGLLSESDRRTIKRTCGTGGSAFARGILAMGLLDEDELAAYIAEHTSWKVAAKNLLDTVQPGAWGSVDRPLVEQLEVLPVRIAGDTLHVAMIDPLDLDTISQLEFFSGYKILPIIATMTQVRSGLLKFLPDYQAAHSQLEDFLKNHSLTASKRVRMADESLYDDLPTPDSFTVKGFEEPAPSPKPTPAKRASAKTAVKAAPITSAPTVQEDLDENEGIEFSAGDDMEVTEVEELSEASFDATDEVEVDIDMSSDSGSDEDDLFSLDEESFAEPTAQAKGASKIELDSFGSDDGDDSVFDDPMLEPDVDLKPATKAKNKFELGDDLEDLMDLSDFDPDKTISDDDLNLDFEPTPKAASKKQTAPAVDIDAPIELSDGLGDDFGDLSDDLNADFSTSIAPQDGSADELFAESDGLLLGGDDSQKTKNPEDGLESAELDSGDLLEPDLDSELSADFNAMSVDSSDDLDLDSFSETKELGANLGAIDETDLSFDGEDSKATTPSIHAAEDDLLSLDESSIDMLSDDEVGNLLEDQAEPEFASVAAATDALLADDGLEAIDDLEGMESSESVHDKISSEIVPTAQSLSININKMFFHVSMASETKTAIGAIASELKASGFSTGMVIGGTANSQFRPECGWQDSQTGNQPSTTAAALQDKGIAAALGRLPAAWTPLDDAVRGGDLKVFASLQRQNKKLYGIKFSDNSAKRDTVIVTAMAIEICENKELMQMAADLFKQVAAKNKGAA
jgi:hypothetical protein